MKYIKHRSKTLFLLMWFLLLTQWLVVPVFTTGQTDSSALLPPKAEKIKKELIVHNHTRIDNYYWLNQRDNPKVIAYLNVENDYLEKVMKHTEKLQDALYNEMVGRLKQDDASVPFRLNGYYYYTRYEKGKEYPLHCRKKGSLNAEEQVMVNGNAIAEGHSYCQIVGPAVSPDNHWLSYGVDTVSRRKYTLKFKNLDTGQILPDEIPNTNGAAAWANDNQTVFYTTKDDSLREFKIWKHKLGTPTTSDTEIFHEADETFTTEVYTSKSRKYIFIASRSTLSTEYRYLDANTPDGRFTIVQPRERNLEYHVEHDNDRFIIRTNLASPNFRLMETALDKTSKENWKEIVPNRDDTLLEGFAVFKNFLVLQERKNGLTFLRVRNWKTKTDVAIDFGEEAYLVTLGQNPEFDTDWMRFNYTSLTTPHSVYDYHMVTREKKLMKEDEVGGGFNKNNYKIERLFATAADGTKIPISLVYKKGIRRNGDNPLLLYGYGSYGMSTDPTFHASRLSILDRGFIYAIAHIRGGQEMGRQWYEDGKLLKKKNTFTDFIDCAKYLIAEKFTNPSKLFASGGSAGGLLMGAVVNLRPDLFKAVIAEVPFVDVVTTMLDKSIPLTTGEFDEWGNPENKTDYDYMLSYSPYDNVQAKAYPALLVTTGLHDSQVQYWEPAKWVAKLRELKTDRHLLLLATNMDAGHGGASGRFQRLKKIALNYAFILDQLGIDQ
ncbi:MAG: S9 family peptidase [Candidatus Omnitrophota bacterium]